MDNNNKTQKDKNSRQVSDLSKIKGIGPSIQRVLNEAGICSYADLAEQTPSGLIALLKDHFPGLSARRIEHADWIGQAQRLARQDSPPASLPWREVADFFVSFGYQMGEDGQEQLQTRVHHSQVDQAAQWDGIATDPLLEWMLKQASLEGGLPMLEASSLALLGLPATGVKKKSEENNHSPKDCIDETVCLEISELWVSEVQVPVTAQAAIERQLLQATGILKISGSKIEQMVDKGLPYFIEMFLMDKATNQSDLAASSSRHFLKDTLTYPIDVQFPLPPVGQYQLYVIARLPPPSMVAAYLQGPIIEVNPPQA